VYFYSFMLRAHQKELEPKASAALKGSWFPSYGVSVCFTASSWNGNPSDIMLWAYPSWISDAALQWWPTTQLQVPHSAVMANYTTPGRTFCSDDQLHDARPNILQWWPTTRLQAQHSAVMANYTTAGPTFCSDGQLHDCRSHILQWWPTTRLQVPYSAVMANYTTPGPTFCIYGQLHDCRSHILHWRPTTRLQVPLSATTGSKRELRNTGRRFLYSITTTSIMIMSENWFKFKLNILVYL
jgi:hypothetical protein